MTVFTNFSAGTVPWHPKPAKKVRGLFVVIMRIATVVTWGTLDRRLMFRNRTLLQCHTAKE